MKKSILIELIGLWLLISCFLGNSREFAIYNYLFSGIFLAVVSINLKNTNPFYKMILSLLGFWLIIDAFIPLLLINPFYFRNLIITGGVVIYFGYKMFPRDTQNTILPHHHSKGVTR